MRVAVFLAKGSEETEVVSTVDLLRRCSQVKVVDIIVVGQSESLVECSHKVRILGDILVSDVKNWGHYDALVLPGGMQGARTFKDDIGVQSALKTAWAAGKVVAAICAAPMAIKSAGIAAGLKATSHPCIKHDVQDHFSYCVDSPVVVDHGTDTKSTLITSQGPGTAILFALAIIESLAGREAKNQVEAPLMIP